MMRRMMTGAVMVAAMAGCQQGQRADGGVTIGMLVGDWTLESIEGTSVAVPDGGRAPTMTVSIDGSVGGFAGVNRWSSKVDPGTISAGGFDLGPIVTTKMAGPPERMELESRYTRLLDQAATFAFDGAALVVHGAGKSAPLRFVRAR